MKTEVYKINRNKPDAGSLRKIAAVLKSGGVAVLPTDTVYGLAVNAFNLDAVSRVYKLKGRSYRKPLVIMAPGIASLEMIAEISSPALKLMEECWPGPLTLVLPTTACGAMLMGGRKDIGVRIPDDDVMLELMSYCDFPLATTSANPSSRPSAKDGAQAVRYFNDKVDVVLDAGKSMNQRESTVLDMLRFPYVVLREGCLPSKKLLQYV